MWKVLVLFIIALAASCSNPASQGGSASISSDPKKDGAVPDGTTEKDGNSPDGTTDKKDEASGSDQSSASSTGGDPLGENLDPEKYSVFYVVSDGDIPECNETRKSHVYFVASSNEFKACDGSSWSTIDLRGPKGDQGIPGAAAGQENLAYETISSQTVVEDGKVINRSTIQYRTEQFSGAVVRQCLLDTWKDTNDISNGYFQYSKFYGPDGCVAYFNRSRVCNAGFANVIDACVPACSNTNLAACDTEEKCTTFGSGMSWVNGQCLGYCSSSNLAACNSLAKCQQSSYGPGSWYNNQCLTACPAGMKRSSRGCENAITHCQSTEAIVDNVCTPISFQTISDNVCGIYDTPVRIASGVHFVTCDATFNDYLYLDAGAELHFDDDWTFDVKKTVYGVGTGTNKIVFKASSGNPNAKWLKLSVANVHGISGLDPFDRFANYNVGTHLEYVDILDIRPSTQSGAINISGYLANVTITGTANVTFSGAYVGGSTVSANQMSFGYSSTSRSYISNNTLTASSFSIPGNLILVWKNSMTGNVSQYGGLSVFNTVTGTYYCSGGTGYYGNKITSTITNSGCSQSDNSNSAVSTKTFVYIDNGSLMPSLSTISGKANPLSAWIINTGGWVTGQTVNWASTYELNGSSFNDQTKTGYTPSFTFTQAESYKVNITTVSGGYTLMFGPQSFVYVAD